MPFRRTFKTALLAGALALGQLLPVAAHAQTPQQEQFFPLQSYRVGPYAAGGTGFFGGFIDYLNLVNTRDGGVGGVKLTWEEGETQYEVERGVEVYESFMGLSGLVNVGRGALVVGFAAQPHRFG